MKSLLIILFTFSSFTLFSQLSANVITVRKQTTSVPVEIIRYSGINIKIDSTTSYEYKGKSKELRGFGSREWFFDNNKVYLFHSPINRRLRRLALKKENKFWKIISKRNIEYEVKNLTATESYFGYQTFQSQFQYKFVIDSNTNDTLNVSTIKIGRKALATTQNTRIMDICIGSDTFYVDMNSTWCNSPYKWQKCELIAISDEFRDQIAANSVNGSYFCNTRIEKQKLSIHLSDDGNISNHLLIFKNSENKEKFKYTLKNDSIFIENPPYKFLSKGRFNRRKNTIRFRDEKNRKSYLFRLKFKNQRNSRYSF